MNVLTSQRTGWPPSMESVKRRIGALTRDDADFKIGITADYERRKNGYRKESAQYQTMILIYETSSQRHVRDMEKALIDHYTGRSDNWQRGGGGLGHPPFYLYVVVGRPKVQIARSTGGHLPPDMTRIRRAMGQLTQNMSRYRIEIRRNVTTKTEERARGGYRKMSVLCTTASREEAVQTAQEVRRMYPSWHDATDLQTAGGPRTGPFQVCVLVNEARPMTE